jgi:hypothetical protein
MKQKDWKEIPPDVHEAIRQARWWLLLFAERITDEIYANELNRHGMAIDCAWEADNLDLILAEYGLPSQYTRPWLDEPETEAEIIESQLMKRR